MSENKRMVLSTLTRRLASRQLGDGALDALADELLAHRAVPNDVHATDGGVIADFMITPQEAPERLPELLTMKGFDGMQIFPKGIIVNDGYLVQITIGMR